MIADLLYTDIRYKSAHPHSIHRIVLAAKGGRAKCVEAAGD